MNNLTANMPAQKALPAAIENLINQVDRYESRVNNLYCNLSPLMIEKENQERSTPSEVKQSTSIIVSQINELADRIEKGIEIMDRMIRSLDI